MKKKYVRLIMLISLTLTCFNIINCFSKSKVRENKVSFVRDDTNGENIVLISVKFTKTDACVSSKQQLVKIYSKDQSVIVLAGRHASKSAADCFNNWIPASKTIFQHSPKKLNFAVKGTLNIIIAITSTQYPQFRDYTFQNIVLGQGHSFITNNWWFGGSSCESTKTSVQQKIGLKSVVCKDTKGENLFFYKTPMKSQKKYEFTFSEIN